MIRTLGYKTLTKIKQKRECPICKNCGSRKFKVLNGKEKKSQKNEKKLQCVNCGNTTLLV